MNKVVHEAVSKEGFHRRKPARLVGPSKACGVALVMKENVEALEDSLRAWKWRIVFCEEHGRRRRVRRANVREHGDGGE